jgi:hypothetical protein
MLPSSESEFMETLAFHFLKKPGSISPVGLLNESALKIRANSVYRLSVFFLE